MFECIYGNKGKGTHALLAELVFLAVALVGRADTEPYRYDVDLDEPAATRYEHIVKDICSNPQRVAELNAVFDPIKDEIGNYAVVVQGFLKKRPEMPEFEGIANNFKTHCGFNWNGAFVALANYVYQIGVLRHEDYDLRQDVPGPLDGTIGCTSVVAADAEGHVIHGRNLDWINQTYYAPLTTELTYKRGGKVLAKTLSFFPELGPATAMAEHVSFSYNARLVGLPDFAQLLGCIISNTTQEPFQLYVRQRMLGINDTAGEATYAQLTQELKQVKYCTPAYLILSGDGPYEGTVLAVSQVELAVEHSLNASAEDGWFVLVANRDLNNKSSWNDHTQKAIDTMKEVGREQATKPDGMMTQVLSRDGVKKESTCYTSVLDVKAQTAVTVVRINGHNDSSSNSTVSSSVGTSSSSSSGKDSGNTHKLNTLLAVCTLAVAFVVNRA